MSGRGTDSAIVTALGQPHVMMVVLLELQLDGGTIYLASHPTDIEYGGHTYVAAQHIGTIEAVTETDNGAQGLAFTLAAANQAAIAAAITEPVQGRKVIMSLGVIDGTTLRVDPAVWSGYFDVQLIQDTAQAPVIRVTAEHAFLRWQQPGNALFSHQDQQQVAAGDLFFEHAAQMAEATLVWPGKEALS